MKMGEGPHGPSWLGRAIGLRDRLGLFRLAFLETVLRAADARASREVPNVLDPALREEPPAYDSTNALSPEEQSLVADLVEGVVPLSRAAAEDSRAPVRRTLVRH